MLYKIFVHRNLSFASRNRIFGTFGYLKSYKMRFGKEFASQMVPEWQGAYMDYSYLKGLLKDIKIFRQKFKDNNGGNGGGGLNRVSTIYKPFNGLLTKSLSRIGSAAAQKRYNHDDDNAEEDVVLEVKSKEGNYETKFLFSNDEGGEYELVFFKRLDDEFNMVNKFYKDKVQEMMKEAALLNKQMDALIAFRIKVDNPDGVYELHHNDFCDHDNGCEERVHMSSIEESNRSGRRDSDEFSEENDQSSRGNSDHESISIENVNDNDTVAINPNAHREKPKDFRARRPVPLEILNNVKINNTLETPRLTIKGILGLSNNHEWSFEKKDLRKAEAKLKQVFIQFHQKLQLLKSYSFVNLSAFSNIMEKYDKITSRNASRPYLNMVDNSYIGNSEDITKLMERVEVAFIKHFSNSNHSKGMHLLKPRVKRERHRISFSMGFFTGCSIALIVALIMIIHARQILQKEGSSQYMVTMFPLYSLFGFIVLHMLIFGVNIYFWRRYRVNYVFIFGLNKWNELGFRELFLLSAGLSTLALTSVLANLDMEMDDKTKDYEALTELVPLALVCLVLFIAFCPFNIVYRSSRYFIMTCVFRCICAPLYKVTLPDFFLADQLTSQVQALRSLEFYICYYGWGDFHVRQNTCKHYNVYNMFYYIIATIPYMWRFLQCLRRLFEEKDPMQGYNGLKYLTTIVAVLTRTAYKKQMTAVWWGLACISSAAAGIFSLYWDLVIDWGLLQRNSKNRWLRDKLLLSHKSVYFVAIGLNLVLRFAWLETVFDFEVSFLHKEALSAIVASLEIIRRGIWNFFRLENEHLNNVGHYRAFKSVPLPFNYEDGDDDKDD